MGMSPVIGEVCTLPVAAGSELTSISCAALQGRGAAKRVRAADIERLSALKGVKLVCGSLNLVARQPTWLKLENAFHAAGEHHYWDAEINGLPVILNRWVGCPAHVFEVFSAVHLRSALGLGDNSPVVLSFPRAHVDHARSGALVNLFVWYALWRWRERLYYAGERYLGMLRHPCLRRCTRRAFQ